VLFYLELELRSVSSKNAKAYIIIATRGLPEKRVRVGEKESLYLMGLSNLKMLFGKFTVNNTPVFFRGK
jgi:hypothetical protein